MKDRERAAAKSRDRMHRLTEHSFSLPHSSLWRRYINVKLNYILYIISISYLMHHYSTVREFSAAVMSNLTVSWLLFKYTNYKNISSWYTTVL